LQIEHVARPEVPLVAPTRIVHALNTARRSAPTNATRRGDARTVTTWKTGWKPSGSCRVCRRALRPPAEKTWIQTKRR